MRRVLLRAMPAFDWLASVVIYPAGSLMRLVRRIGVNRLPRCRNALERVGVFPVLDHYYEPLFRTRDLRLGLDRERALPGVDWNIDGQLNLLGSFGHEQELADLPVGEAAPGEFSMENGWFGPGDAEFLYQLIRLRKPRRVMEIGGGLSTLVARMAIEANTAENPGDGCRHTCIEPYEAPWLESTGAHILRERVERVDRDVFEALGPGDLLFIDSSHVIRPQGDVLDLYLDVLPRLATGVVVHIHDIFSPRDYPKAWVVDEVRLWNEQYLVEAFLSNNVDWRVIGALNQLRHHQFDLLKEKCPFLTASSEPSSLYIERARGPA